MTECGITALTVGNDVYEETCGKGMPYIRAKVDKPDQNGEGEVESFINIRATWLSSLVIQSKLPNNGTIHE